MSQLRVFSILLAIVMCLHSSSGILKDCLDLAIVGGGVGGTYTAYRNRNSRQRIGLFEVTNRIGGRMFTAEIPTRPGVGVEFGAMRFLPSLHTRLASLVNEVGLTTTDFRNTDIRPLYYLRGRHLTYEELGGPKTPYNLKPDEKLPPTDLLWKLLKENTNITRDASPTEKEIYSIVTKDGQLFYKMTFDQFFEKYASTEAINYLKDTSESNPGYVAAHAALVYLIYPNSNITLNLKTIQEGFSALPRRLLSSFLKASESHKVHLNHQLLSIDNIDGKYKLGFEVTDPTLLRKIIYKYAQKVVLAIQKDSVERIAFTPFKRPCFRIHLNAVFDIPSVKIFLAYPSMWWKRKRGNENITDTVSDIQASSFEWPDDGSIQVAYLKTLNDADYWSQLQSLGRPICGSMHGDERVTTEVVQQINSNLRRIYGISIPDVDIPWPVGGGMKIWNKFPFAAAWHKYKPGIMMSETRDYMLKPFRNQDVYLVGNSWWPNELQGWSESTLRMVDLLMERYLH